MSGSFVDRACRPLAALITGAIALPLFAQNAADWSAKEVLAKETYVKPPAVIERLVDAPRSTNVSLQNLSPDRKLFLDTKSAGLPTLKEFGKSHYYFAGLQVDHKANRARALTTRGSAGIQVVDAATGKSRAIETPRGASVSAAEWSPDARSIAYIANFEDASRLYVADVATGKSKVLVQTPLLATLVTSLAWTTDGRIVTVLLPDGRAAEPRRPEIETGPLVRITDPSKNPQRIFASLLRDPFEKDLMKYFITGQLAIVDSKTGAVKKVGAPGMISAVDPSPDGKYIRVTSMVEPFSYIVQYGSFGTVDQLWDADGRLVAELAKRPLRASGADDPLATPTGQPQVDTSARSIAWMPNGQGLYFLKQDRPAPRAAQSDTSEAPRGGMANRGKDKLYQWAAPFDKGSEKVLVESDNRIGGVLFNDDASVVFVAENNAGMGHVYAVYANEPGKKYTIWRLRGINAQVGNGFGGFGGGGRGGTGDDSATFYMNPGSIVTKTGHTGRDVAQISADGRYAFLRGTKYFRDWETQAPRGFVDKVEIKTGQKTRLFEGANDVFESVNASLDDDMTQLVITRESPTMVPNAVLKSSGATVNLTSNTDPTPEFTKAIRKRIKVTRSDGINFSVNLTLPADYTAGTRLPAMLWLYPYEFTDQAGYDRTLRTENINKFPQGGPRSIEFLVLQGYAVANFSPPVIGSAGRMNDNYVSDLQRNLIAVIDELDKQGFIDRTRLGIGGHSYGAFTTVNALVHTPYFKAGIAGDGMYNRTLTPFNFQSERRDFFEAQQTYLEMSPFFNADKMQGALLMYHSIEDQNVGTAPISSERMMHALEGLGKTASLYMYPYEDHGPAARETLLDQWARWTAWLDVYVKNANKPKVAS